MANRKLKSLKFPGIDDTYILDAGNVNYSDEETYEEGSVGEGLNALKEDIRDIASINKLEDLTEYPYDEGYLTSGGVFVADAGGTQKTTTPIYLPAGSYTVDISAYRVDVPINYVRAVAVYNSANVCTSYTQSDNLKTFTVGENDSYVRINSNYTTVTTYDLYLTGHKDDVIIKLNENAQIPTDTTLSIAGKAADAKATGDRIGVVSEAFSETDIDLLSYTYVEGYLNSNGSVTSSPGGTQRTSEKITLESGAFILSFDGEYNGAPITNIRALCVYNADDSVVKYYGSTPTAFIVPNDNCYVRFNYSATTVNSFITHKGKYEDGAMLLADTVVLPKVKAYNYVHARRAVIAFILDGEYNQNSNMEAVFSNHNVKAGFAIQYDTTFPNNTINKYFEWENNGHEILAHSSVAVGPNGSATDAQIQKIVKDSYETLSFYGFNIHGFVAYQGSTKPVTVEAVKKYFDYGCDALNHSGSEESCMFFGTDAPYMLWRYSMQISTLQEMKNAVDRCISQTGLLIFYGHARSDVSDNFTVENLDALLTYIESVNGTVKKPCDAISDFYSIRYEDIQ